MSVFKTMLYVLYFIVRLLLIKSRDILPESLQKLAISFFWYLHLLDADAEPDCCHSSFNFSNFSSRISLTISHIIVYFFLGCGNIINNINWLEVLGLFYCALIAYYQWKRAIVTVVRISLLVNHALLIFFKKIKFEIVRDAICSCDLFDLYFPH